MHTIDGAPVARLPLGDTDLDARSILARHKRVGRTCSGCDYVSTKTQPLCPAAQRALRELADRGRRPAATRAMACYADAELLTIADQHTGEHRCRRCGFAYSHQVRSCPAYRRVRAEMEARGVMPIASASSASDGLCAGRAGGWSVDETVNPAAWRAAMDTCERCPLLARCRANLDSQLAEGLRPKEQIVAGVLFTTSGRVVTRAEVSQYALTRGRTDRTRVRRAPHAPSGMAA